MLAVALCWLAMGPNYQVIRSFETLPVESDEYLTNPYAMAFSPQGRLFLADSKSARVHVWDARGKYLKSFGKQGRGPGELFLPATLEATESHLWIWDFTARLHQFDHEGGFIKVVKMGNIRPRDFAVLSDDLLLVAHKKIEGPTDIRAVFSLATPEGRELEVIKAIKIESYLTPREGSNATTTKAFAPEFDIERIAADRWVFGFSQNSVLYEVDAQGKIVEERRFDLPTEKPSDADRELMANLRGPIITGDVFSIKDLPNLRINYDHDKSFYTHLLVQGSHVAFVLTPLGGMTGCGNGFSEATYHINDLQTGKRIDHGRYRFSENSVILYRDGRVLGVLLNEEDEFEVVEIALEGMAK